MFLRQLTLKGFKSFAETTVLSLEPGVTVVVGPNGSGKSNVVDAIAWVLGAQAPSAVRSQKMDDVIFAGTAKRPALGRAEVSLTIDNANGLLPIEFTEVTLTRTLWRSGDSEYAINGVPCRLLDVQELLSDSGVGRQQHVIVGQGQIDAVLNARPEDRRAVIEEAAGVLKYRKRKERAERRLDATEASLLRVQDLLREVRRQLRPLERQAEAARRHGEVVAELTALRVHVAGREIAGLQRRLEGLAVEERDLRQQDETVRRELARMDTEVLAAEARLSASGASDLGDLLVRVEQLRERARGLTAVLHERRRSLERDRVQLMDASVAASLEAEAARLRSEQAAVAEAQAALEPDVAALEADEEAAAARRALAAGDDLADGTSTEDGTAGRPDTTRAARAAAEVRGELHARRSAHQADDERLVRAEAALAALGERHAGLDGAVEAARTRFARAEEAEAPLLAALGAAQAAHTAARSAAEDAGAARAAAAERHTEWSAAGRCPGPGARRRPRPGRRRALERGRRRTRHAARPRGDRPGLGGGRGGCAGRGARRGGRHRCRGGTACPRPSRPGGRGRRRPRRGRSVSSAGGTDARRRVRDHVRAVDPTVDGLLDRLLQQAVVVAGPWADALDVAVAHPSAVVVTRNGDRFSVTGFRLGLGGAGATASALDEARRRTEEAAIELAATTAALAAATVAVEEAQAEQSTAASAPRVSRRGGHAGRHHAGAPAAGAPGAG